MVLVSQLRRFIYVLAIFAGFAGISAFAASRQQWQDYKPSLKSQVAPLKRTEAESLLKSFCSSFTDSEEFGLTCKTRPLGSAFTDIVEQQFHPQGVIFGHFLEPDPDAAVVSGWSFEGHPDHWGGTLLLKRDRGTWKAVWYKSGLITSFCEKARLPDGRELLLCEFEDAGMGQRYHVLYGVDLRRPSAEIRLTEADSFESDFCHGQRQVMELIEWGAGRASFAVTIRTPEWYILEEGACGTHTPKRPPRTERLEFGLTEAGVRRVQKK